MYSVLAIYSSKRKQKDGVIKQREWVVRINRRHVGIYYNPLPFSFPFVSSLFNISTCLRRPCYALLFLRELFRFVSSSIRIHPRCIHSHVLRLVHIIYSRAIQTIKDIWSTNAFLSFNLRHCTRMQSILSKYKKKLNY